MGNFPVVLYYKLMKGLESVIPDRDKRKRHILTRMIFMSELNSRNCKICKLIFNEEINLYEGDTLQMNFKDAFGIDSFDIVFGNPPFNTEQLKTGSSPLFTKFIEKVSGHYKYLSFILPSKYFAGGRGLDGFRKAMLSRKDIVSIKQFDDASLIFGNSVDIKGGIHYLLIDVEYSGKCRFWINDFSVKIALDKYDILISKPEYYSIIDKMLMYTSLSTIYINQNYFGINTNDKRLLTEKTSKSVVCYVSQEKGLIKYIDGIRKDYKFHKVVTPEASHKGGSGFGNLFIGNDKCVLSKTYVGFKVDTIEEAESLLSFLKCRLPNFLLSIRKITHHTAKKTIEWIPLPLLDREWTDKKVYKHFGLTKDEIEIVQNATIVGYDKN